MFRKATLADLDAISAIYDAIHDREEAGLSSIGWVRSIYPTRATAEESIALSHMFVLEQDGRILAAARINQEQCEQYALVNWEFEAPEDQVLVLHTLVVSPHAQGKGCARQVLEFYEQTARDMRCSVLRIDTNLRNERARAMYRKHGYRESGVVDCDFNGIPDVQMVCLEKKVVQ